MTSPIYLNASAPVEDRVTDLIERMDVDEKLAQLGAVEFPRLMTKEGLDREKALVVVPRGIGQVTRIGATTGLEPVQSAELFNQIQQVPIPELSNTDEYEDSVSPPVGNHAFAVRY